MNAPNAVMVVLTKGQVALVDPDDKDLVVGYAWSAREAPGGRWYAQASQHYERGEKRPPHLLLHRLVMHAPDGVLVDHVNIDGLDCRKANLRFATNGQNRSNSRKLATASSRFKGVTFWARRAKWGARIKVDGVSRNLGWFDSEEAAARAYDDAAGRLHGAFARLNFPGAAS